MASVNKVMIVGYVGQDPEISSGKKCDIAKFSVATQRGYDKDSDTDWHRCVCFDDTRINFIEDHVKKGDLVFVEGSINYGKYENNDGNTVYTTDIVVYRIEKIKDASDNGGNDRRNKRDRRDRRDRDDDDRGSRRSNSRRKEEPEEEPFDDDDLPF